MHIKNNKKSTTRQSIQTKTMIRYSRSGKGKWEWDEKRRKL